LAGGLNLYGYAGGDPINFSDPFGLCPTEVTGKPCTAGEITLRPGVVVSNGTLVDGARTLAGQTGRHVSIHGGDRGFNPEGSNDFSQHRIDLGGKGAIDFHLFNADGTQVPDAEAVTLIQESGGMPKGMRLIHHGPQTNTQGQHLHGDTRTDIGDRKEERGVYTPLKKP
jgi:hypothetical protein